MKKKIQVMVVDDSAVVRQTIKSLLENDADIEITALAQDPIIAIRKLKQSIPDVILLDIEMPRMDGLTFLQRLMRSHPLPVVICSSQAGRGSENALHALEYGAVDIIEKPQMGTKQFLEESRIKIRDAILSAKLACLEKIRNTASMQIAPKLTADVVLSKPSSCLTIKTTETIVVVGASTGGTEALRVFLKGLPIDAPGVVIVQHMPEKFTAAFAKRLNMVCDVEVKEAENNDSILRGRVLIAPGNKHTLIQRSGAVYYVEVKDGPLVCRHRPSVDVLFRSTARYAGKNAVGIIMTGMGDDGARGMKEMKDAGSYNIAQDEATSVVFGMPNEAIKRDAVDAVVPLERIPQHLLDRIRR